MLLLLFESIVILAGKMTESSIKIFLVQLLKMSSRTSENVFSTHSPHMQHLVSSPTDAHSHRTSLKSYKVHEKVVATNFQRTQYTCIA